MAYIIVDPVTLVQYPQVVFRTKAQADKARQEALETYGITTDYVVCKVEPVVNV